MPTVEELIAQIKTPVENRPSPALPEEKQGPGLSEEKQGPGLSEKIMEMLSVETGEGDIDDYVSHPLNIWQSEGVAQIIRGVTGLTGNSLRLAVVDIVFGWFRFKNERMKGAGAGV